MALQLRIYVPPHPLIRHWLAVARDKHTPVPIFRTAINELGRWLTYEAIRDLLPTEEVSIETPLQPTIGQVINPATSIAIDVAGLIT